MGGTAVVQRGRRWAVVAYAGVDPETHRQRQKWFSGFATRKEAEQFRLTLAHHPSFSAGMGPFGSPRLRTEDYITHWIGKREKLERIRSKTASGYRELSQLHILPRLGHIPLGRLSPPAIDSLYISLRESGLSAATVRQIAAILHAALNDATRSGLILRNPCANTTPPSPEPYEPVILTAEQIRRYLDDAERTTTPPMYALYVTAVGAGCRLGELLGARETDLDLQAGLLHVRRSLSRAGAKPAFGRPKTARGLRTIRLPDEAIKAIGAALLWKKKQRLRLGQKFRDAGLIFCGRRGRPINPSNLRTRDHLPRLARLGLPRIRPHDLRHAHATYLIAAGVDARTVADRLGHASPSFTLKRYAHAASQAQEHAVGVANELLMKTGQIGR